MDSKSEMLQGLRRRRGDLFDELASWDPERLSRKPGVRTWSMVQIVEHLVRAEREVLEQLPNPSDLVERNRGLGDRLRYWFVLLVLWLNLPVPVVSEGMAPKGNLTIDDVRRLSDENLEWLTTYVEATSPEEQKRAVFRHPVAGPLHVGQALRLGSLHQRAHMRQVRRNKALLGPSDVSVGSL